MSDTSATQSEVNTTNKDDTTIIGYGSMAYLDLASNRTELHSIISAVYHPVMADGVTKVTVYEPKLASCSKNRCDLDTRDEEYRHHSDHGKHVKIRHHRDMSESEFLSKYEGQRV
jgi:hypothetical protein